MPKLSKKRICGKQSPRKSSKIVWRCRGFKICSDGGIFCPSSATFSAASTNGCMFGAASTVAICLVLLISIATCLVLLTATFFSKLVLLP
jgi:hypothetical protein